jgi:hypothetical protein
MKTLWFTTVLIILGINLIIAQPDENMGSADGLRRNIVALKIKIENIKELAIRYNNQSALTAINDAEADFNAANDLLNRWFGGERRNGFLDQARAKYQSSNRKADYASSLILQIPTDNMRTELEQLIQEAEIIAHNNNSQEIRYYLNKARAYNRKASSAFAENQFFRGHEYLKVGIYFANKVIEAGNSGQSFNSREKRFDDLVNNIRNMLNKAASITNDDPVLRDLYESAREYFNKALAENNQGNVGKAFSNLQISEKFLNRLFDLAENDKESGEDLRNEYQSLGIYLNSVRREVHNSNQTSNILQKAEDLYNEAGKNIETGDLQKASQNMRLSQRMALKAFKSISVQSNNFDDIQNRLNEVNHLLQLQGEKVRQSENKSVKGLYNQALKLFNQAQTDYTSGRNNQVLYSLNLCLRILSRNEKLIGDTTPGASTTYAEVNADLLNTQQLVIRLQQNPALTGDQVKKIETLVDLLEDARKELLENNIAAANQIISIVKNQLSNSLRI